MISYILSYLYIQILGFLNILVKPDKNNINSNVIVSLTTIPSRSYFIINTINSILLQTIVPRKIYIGIPLKSKREPYLQFKFTDNITHNSIVEIITYDMDSGPIMKLITGLDQLTDMIITVDDDTIYEKHLIENLIKNNDKSLVYCTIGRDIYGNKLYGTKTILRSVEGYGGVLYRKNMFDSNFKDNLINQPYYIYTNDDLYISSYLYNKKIEIYCIDNNINEPFCTYLNTIKSNPLWIINEKNNNFNMAKEQLRLFKTM